MLRTSVTLFKLCFYAALILFGVTFAVSNRARIDLTFFPLPYAVSMPIFLFAILVLTIGIVLGWTLAGVKSLKLRREHRHVGKRAEALENELSALRSEQLMKPVSLPQK